MRNLNLLFNKLYYENVGQLHALEEDIKRYNTILFSPRLFDPRNDFREAIEGAGVFRLETVYPGMILGSGNPHGVHMTDNDVNMGFSFDFVTGQPYIPGSTVKGILRSCFEQYPDVIRELTGCDELDMKALVRELFEGNDVFLDAVVCRSDTLGRLIGEDYITPHPDPLKDPKPIHIIKIMPGVGFEFRFLLYEDQDKSTISANAKLALYKALLKLFGVGSKTNVGYGILKEYDPNRTSLPVAPVSENTGRNQSANRNAATSPRNFTQERANASNRGYSGASQGQSGDVTMKVCPACGKRNYKYKRDGNGNTTTQVNWNWEKNVCFACRKGLE